MLIWDKYTLESLQTPSGGPIEGAWTFPFKSDPQKATSTKRRKINTLATEMKKRGFLGYTSLVSCSFSLDPFDRYCGFWFALKMVFIK